MAKGHRVHRLGAWAAAKELTRALNARRSLRHRLVVGQEPEWDEAERVLDAWQRARGGGAGPSAAIEAYQACARRYPVVLGLRLGKAESIEATLGPGTARGEAGAPFVLLWTVLQNARARDRVRRCPVCERWVFAESRNAGRRFCSDSCKGRWWTREERRKAHHKSEKGKSQKARQRPRVSSRRRSRKV